VMHEIMRNPWIYLVAAFLLGLLSAIMGVPL